MTRGVRPASARAADARSGGQQVVKVVHLVRHAHALDRSTWAYPDEERPLSVKGRRQALELAARLSGVEPVALWSSPATRCRQTLEPLAALLGLVCDAHDELSEGSSPLEALDAVVRAAAGLGGDLVACTHGDVLDGVLGVVARTGATVEGALHAEKASTFELSVVEGSVALVRHVGAPSVKAR